MSRWVTEACSLMIEIGEGIGSVTVSRNAIAAYQRAANQTVLGE